MSQKTVSDGVLHEMPQDLKKKLLSSIEALKTWEDITPVARNEWICWIESAKKKETREKRLNQGIDNLSEGKRRPCCWPGCPHRNSNNAKWFK